MNIPTGQAISLPLPMRIAFNRAKSSRATVLVVDDDAQVRRLICLALGECGCNTLEAANGVEAILSCQCHEVPIDLVISDVVMPHMSGWSLVARLQRSYPAIKILMMSGYDHVQSNTSGPIIPRETVNHVPELLHKPFSIFSLSNRVRQMLEERQ